MFLRQHSIISGLHQKRYNTKRSFSLNKISVCLLHKTEETQQEVDSFSKINFKSHFSKNSLLFVMLYVVAFDHKLNIFRKQQLKLKLICITNLLTKTFRQWNFCSNWKINMKVFNCSWELQRVVDLLFCFFVCGIITKI